MTLYLVLGLVVGSFIVYKIYKDNKKWKILGWYLVY
jgi:hypothetical protein